MGRGSVSRGFYTSTGDSYLSSSLIPETCRSCKGTGVVWSNEEESEGELEVAGIRIIVDDSMPENEVHVVSEGDKVRLIIEKEEGS
jgi:hypothetical protein